MYFFFFNFETFYHSNCVENKESLKRKEILL